MNDKKTLSSAELSLLAWQDCAKELAQKLRRFQENGWLASHDRSLARYEQLKAREQRKSFE